MIIKNKNKNNIEVSVSGHNITSTFKKWGIFYVRVENNAIFTKDSFAFSQKFRLKHQEINSSLLIFEFGKFSSVDVDAREFAAQREDPPFKVEAFVVANLAQRLLVQHYARIMSTRGVTVKTFNDYNAARLWVLSV